MPSETDATEGGTVMQNPESMERLVYARMRDLIGEAHRSRLAAQASSGGRSSRGRLTAPRIALVLTRISLAYHIVFKASANCLGEVGLILRDWSQPQNPC